MPDVENLITRLDKAAQCLTAHSEFGHAQTLAEAVAYLRCAAAEFSRRDAERAREEGLT